MDYLNFVHFIFGYSRKDISNKISLMTKEKYLLPTFTQEDFYKFLKV